MFFNGFKKVANWGRWAMRGADVARKASQGLLSGARAAGSSTIGDAVKLKGLRHVGEGLEAAGKKSGWASKAREIGKGIGKAAPSIAAGGAYAVGAKKLYDKTLGGTENNE